MPDKIKESFERYEAAKGREITTIEVSREEFIAMAVKAGMSTKKANLQASISEGLGSSVLIGNTMVTVKEAT